MIFAIWGGSFLEPDPFNYFFGSGIGTNLGSSILWGFVAGLLGVFVGRKIKAEWAKHVAHNEWAARHLAGLYRKHVGEPEPHPHFELPAGEPLRPDTTLHLDRTKDST